MIFFTINSNLKQKSNNFFRGGEGDRGGGEAAARVSDFF